MNAVYDPVTSLFTVDSHCCNNEWTQKERLAKKTCIGYLGYGRCLCGVNPPMSDDIVGQCACRVEMTLHCPTMCLRPPRGVTREEVANTSCMCLQLSANRR